MQVIDDLLQILLGLILPGHIGKANALGGLDIDLGTGPSGTEHQGVLAPGLLHELFAHVLADAEKNQQRKNDGQEEGQQRRGGLLHLLGEGGPGVIEALGQGGVVHGSGGVDGAIGFPGENDLVALHLHLADVLVLNHLHEGAVVRLRDLIAGNQGRNQKVKEQDHQQGNAVIIE